MGRLIDTDAITDFMLEHNTPDSLFASVEEIVAYQPTAFDIEAVVKELEELKPDIECFDEEEEFKYALKRHNEYIEIIRKGGVNHG